MPIFRSSLPIQSFPLEHWCAAMQLMHQRKSYTHIGGGVALLVLESVSLVWWVGSLMQVRQVPIWRKIKMFRESLTVLVATENAHLTSEQGLKNRLSQTYQNRQQSWFKIDESVKWQFVRLWDKTFIWNHTWGDIVTSCPLQRHLSLKKFSTFQSCEISGWRHQ